MSPLVHRIYIAILTGIVVFVTVYLSWKGVSYYSTSLEERFYHPDHDFFKPSGFMGHGLGIVGTLLILIGVVGYIARKRYLWLSRLGRLKYWLEFHIFLCTLGPIMILFHTAFKFGGIVSIAFWSMVAVVLSGVIGRFIYVQIPHSKEGRELTLNEVQQMRSNIGEILRSSWKLDEESYNAVLESTKLHYSSNSGNVWSSMVSRYFEDRKTLANLRKLLKEHDVSRGDIRKILQLVSNEMALNNRIERLQYMKTLFQSWHVVHLPFAIIMLVIVVLHVGITLAFGYTWIF